MAEKKKMFIPLPLLLLDAVGALMLALGLYAHFSAPGPLILDGVIDLRAWKVPLMVVGGFLLMVALVLIVRAAQAQRDA